MTSRSYFGKMNSTLGSVVPLAMFFTKSSAFGNIFFDYTTQSMVLFYLDKILVFGPHELREIPLYVILLRSGCLPPGVGNASCHQLPISLTLISLSSHSHCPYFSLLSIPSLLYLFFHSLIILISAKLTLCSDLSWH